MEKGYKRHYLVRLLHKNKPALLWFFCDAVPVTAALVIFCAGCLAVMLTVGEMQPPGPGADLSCLHSSSNRLSLCDRYDGPAPGATYATRTGQDLEMEVMR